VLHRQYVTKTTADELNRMYRELQKKTGFVNGRLVSPHVAEQLKSQVEAAYKTRQPEPQFDVQG